jgi:predicted ATPase/DNA-binding winged helix-turn-helix (wHTH) protein
MDYSEERDAPKEPEYVFGPFSFVPARQRLSRAGTPLPLGARALAILAELVERPGILLSKRELMRRVWPETVVEESNLKVQVAALRRALGDGEREHRYIGTVTGRGYSFIAPVDRRGGAVTAPPAETPAVAPAGAPVATRVAEPAAPAVHKSPAAARAIGRDAAIRSVLELLRQRRFATLVGPGGIGKTTVALAVAEAAVAEQGLELCFVDLSPLAHPRFVTGAIAAALGLSIHSGDAVPALAACLRERRLLLVLDSCEHVIEAAAPIAEGIVAAAPGVLLLSTSREPLRVAGECVHRLAPLDVPPAQPSLTAAQAMAFPAIQLFSERAAECVENYRLSDADAPAAAEICRRLDGNALAIELAATRIDAFGVRELAARLDDQFRLLRRGRRGAQPRHRTLAATLDWSYEFLRPVEQTVLRAASVFAGAFTLDAAAALCARADYDADAIIDAVAELVAKSLLSADAAGPATLYRLLDTTKAYAQDKLERCGEAKAARRRHAELCLAQFERGAVEWEARPTAGWLADYGRGIDDARGALAWAASPGGDGAVGLALTVAAIPLWMHLSLLGECRRSVEQALAGGMHGRPAPRQEMKLHAALAAAILHTRGPRAGTHASWLRALTLAERLGDGEYQLRALWGLAVHHSYTGEYRAVLELAERFRAIADARGDRAARVSVDRLIATALHYLGEQRAARARLDAMLGHYVAPVHRSHIARFQLDQRAAALGTLANVLWLQGHPDQAVRAARGALQCARDTGHALSLLNALVHAACPVHLYVGDYAEAERLLDELHDHLARHALTVWSALWRCLRGMLLARRGDAAGLPLLRGALDELGQSGFRLRHAGYLSVLAAALGEHGLRDEALSVVAEALHYCEDGEERWCLPEVLRIKGELLEAGDAGAAELLYRRALDIAEAQDAPAWALRAATSLAGLLARRGRPEAGRQALAAVYARYTEGHDSIDLRRARALLEAAV